MSNLVPTDIKLPAHLAGRVNQQSALNAALTGGLSSNAEGGYPRISIKGARFRIVEDGNETVLDSTALDVVIVGANPKLSKTYYASTWTPDNEPSAPDCQSLDGIRPDASVENPQNDLCATCPMNAWGSKTTPQGQSIKACADQKRLAIVAADDPTGPVYLLNVTPAALKNLNQYQRELSMRGIPAEIVKTRITFDTEASFPKLKFGFGGFIDEDTQTAVDKLFGADHVKKITGEAVVTQEQIEATGQADAEVKAPVKETAPEPEPTPEPTPEPVAEETPQRGFGAAAKPEPEATPTPEPKPEPKQESKPEPKPKQESKPEPKKEESSSGGLADEIADLINEVGLDDD